MDRNDHKQPATSRHAGQHFAIFDFADHRSTQPLRTSSSPLLDVSLASLASLASYRTTVQCYICSFCGSHLGPCSVLGGYTWCIGFAWRNYAVPLSTKFGDFRRCLIGFVLPVE